MFTTADPGPWQYYVKRADNVGLPTDVVRRKYLTESLTFQQQMEQMMMQAQAVASAAAGGASAPAAPSGPVGGSGTIVFDGVSQYIQAPNAQVINWLPGTGPFTIEWFMKKGGGNVGAPRVFSLGYDTGATIGCSIEGGDCYIWPYTGPYLKGSMPANYNNKTGWTHIAVCRDETSTTRLYIGGVLKATRLNDTRSIDNSVNPDYDLNMGVDNPASGNPNWWGGNLTNFRWDNSAIYTGDHLDVPTAPLTKTVTTKLLMLGGTTANPVSDATGLNTLINHGATWSDLSPFV